MSKQDDFLTALRKALPEFTVSRLSDPGLRIPVDGLNGHKDEVPIEDKIAISLPEEKANLRLGLHRELTRRVGFDGVKDIRVPYGVCFSDEVSQAAALRDAAEGYLFADLTIDYLEKNTPEDLKRKAREQIIRDHIPSASSIEPSAAHVLTHRRTTCRK